MNFQEASSYLLKEAESLGIDIEILSSQGRELTIDTFQGELSQITQATQGGIGLRVISGGKTGYASTEETSQEALDWILSEAKENAELQTTTDGFIPEGKALGQKDLIGEGLSASVDEKAQKAIDFEAAVRKHPNLKQVMISRYTESETQGALASSKGASGGYRNGYTVLGSSFIMEKDDNLKQSFGLDWDKEFHSLDPNKTAVEATENMARLLGAKPLQTGKYTAYFEPKAFGSLLSVLMYMFSGKTLMEGKSRLQGKIGSSIAASNITLIDDPTLERGIATRPFDSEGTASQKTVLIENGIMRSFLHNSQTAKATSQDNTGHASRGYSSTLGVSPTNIYVDAGEGITFDNGIVITEVMGVHAGANPITGDISLQAFGLHYDGGEFVQPVEDFVVSGNLLEMLESVSGLGDTVEWHLSSGAPMVEIPDLSFAGK